MKSTVLFAKNIQQNNLSIIIVGNDYFWLFMSIFVFVFEYLIHLFLSKIFNKFNCLLNQTYFPKWSLHYNSLVNGYYLLYSNFKGVNESLEFRSWMRSSFYKLNKKRNKKVQLFLKWILNFFWFTEIWSLMRCWSNK